MAHPYPDGSVACDWPEPCPPSDPRFEVLGLLGEGGAAEVYKVRDRRDGAIKALKILREPKPSTRQRLVREHAAMRVLRHAHVVQVEDLPEVDGEPALLMEWVDGPSLFDLLQTRAVDLGELDALADGILEAVALAHAAGLLHRDLKPANILLKRSTGGWIPKIADFGLSKDGRQPACPHGRGRPTETGAIMGTANYMSPEQARDAKHVDERSDVFALGCILYEMATGRMAFDGPDQITILSQVVAGRTVPVRSLAPLLPDRFVQAITGALQPDPADRIGDVETLLAVWRGELRYEAPVRTSPAPATLERPPPPPRAELWGIGPWVFAAAAAGLLLGAWTGLVLGLVAHPPPTGAALAATAAIHACPAPGAAPSPGGEPAR